MSTDHKRRHAAALTLATVAFAALCSAPAFAAQTTLPGFICHSDETAERPTTGALLNSATASGTTKFRCPVMRTEPVGAIPTVLTLYLHAKLNYNPAQFGCTLRSVTTSGGTYDSNDVILPSGSGYWSTSVSVALPQSATASVSLRCNVPNIYSGDKAGILSYRVDD
jgi:hypothetical protein